MAPKTKKDPAFPLDFPDAIPGPDALEPSVDTGADSLGGEGQAQPDQAAEAAAAEGALTPTGLADLERILNEVGARTAGGVADPACLAFVKAEGGEVALAEHTARVTLAGITVVSDYGIHRALLDWCMIATRRIMAAAK